jgi:hypothetical protein
MASGGYRPQRVNTEAVAVSGPGKLSQRTDMIPSGGTYGSRKANEEIMSGAAMPAGTKSASGTPSSPPRISATPVTGLFEPSQNSNPVTDGYPFGPGATPEPQIPEKYAMLRSYTDRLDSMASQPDAPEAFRRFWDYTKTIAKGS